MNGDDMVFSSNVIYNVKNNKQKTLGKSFLRSQTQSCFQETNVSIIKERLEPDMAIDVALLHN